MAYFQELPNISYPSLLSANNKVEDRIIVKNLFKRSKLRTDVDQSITAFNYYYIEQGMRPDVLAQEIYGDSELDWVVLTSNNITNVRDQWPLEHNDLNEYMLKWFLDQLGIKTKFESAKNFDFVGKKQDLVLEILIEARYC